MANLHIVEGNFALVLEVNRSERWIVHDSSMYGIAHQHVSGFATVTDDGTVVDVYTTRVAAEKAIDAKVQAARKLAKYRSGASWS